MSNESKIVLSNKQNGTTTEIIDNNSDSNVSKKFLLPDESGKLLTEEKTNLMYLTKDNAESKYRKLEDSYSKEETDNKLSEKLAVSTYNNDKQTFATKTDLSNGLNTKANSNATVNLTGNQTVAGVKTFSIIPVCNILPTADNQVSNRNYVKKRGGFVGITGGAIDLNRGMNFSLNLTGATNITVANAASNIGQTGEIYVSKGANIRAFNAPFNFRVSQSGFGNNEVFSYLVVSASLVRITRS